MAKCSCKAAISNNEQVKVYNCQLQKQLTISLNYATTYICMYTTTCSRIQSYEQIQVPGG